MKMQLMFLTCVSIISLQAIEERYYIPGNTLKGHNYGVRCLTYDPKTNYLYSGSYVGKIREWKK